MSSDPRSVREALLAQLIGDVDQLLRRAEQLTQQMPTHERSVLTAVETLVQAGEKYQAGLLAFNEAAKRELGSYLHRKAEEVAKHSTAAQRAELREAARAVFAAAASEQAQALQESIGVLLAKLRSSGHREAVRLVAASSLGGVLALLLARLLA